MSGGELRVRVAWRTALGAGGGDPHSEACDAVLEEVFGRYREPHRRYHGLSHLVAVVDHVEQLAHGLEVPLVPEAAAALIAAAVFHDAIYDPRASGNEVASAALAMRELSALGWSPELCTATADFVRATAHTSTDAAERLERLDRQALDVLLDADLAVLGAEPAPYAAYAAAVRAEYDFVDDDAWRQGRSAVLRSFLGREHIYRTAQMLRDREQRARANLSAELRVLSGNVSGTHTRRHTGPA